MSKALKLSNYLFRKGLALRLAAIASLALGLGPTVVAFGALDRLLFPPLPFAEPERLVQIHLFVNADPRLQQAFLPGIIADELVQRRDLFDGVGSITGASLLDVSPSQDSQPLHFTSMSSNGLDVLGVTPVQGRALVEGSERIDTNQRPRADFPLEQDLSPSCSPGETASLAGRESYASAIRKSESLSG